jgi:hypothetical protein
MTSEGSFVAISKGCMAKEFALPSVSFIQKRIQRNRWLTASPTKVNGEDFDGFGRPLALDVEQTIAKGNLDITSPP